MTVKSTRRDLLTTSMGLGAAFALLRPGALLAKATRSAARLEREFLTPPQPARPHVWWHWMNGNVSMEGARLDLEWMKRVGIGGVHCFSGGKFGTRNVVSPLAPFMSPTWQATLKNSVNQARAADMDVVIAGSPGWHVTGGPWVPAGDGMKKYVWSELAVAGGTAVPAALPHPPTATGPFQGVKGSESNLTGYGDSVVFAFPTPEAEKGWAPARWTTAAGPVELGPISGDDGGTAVKLPLNGANEIEVFATLPKPLTIGALALGVSEGADFRIERETSPGRYETVCTGTIASTADSDERLVPQVTFAFSPVRARRFRIVLAKLTRTARTGLDALRPPLRSDSFNLTRMALLPGARVNGFEAKAGFEPTIRPEVAGSPSVPRELAIDSSSVVDLTERLRADGTFDWQPGPGNWTVVRLGWSLTGRVNGPAETSATGLEVDKFDGAAVRRYLTHYLGLYDQASGQQVGPRGIGSLLTDSWEAGIQNWTPALLAEFRSRRGYDPAPFLPVLTGRVVDSSDASENFLFDFRQTLKQLVADNHYGVIASELSARGITYYTEALGDNARAIADGMSIKARADIPTAEFWYRAFATAPGQPPLKADLEEAASVGHVYGKPIIAAESLTVAAVSDPWAFSPAMLKRVVDEIFARGVNRILLHESHHQPLVDKKPGLKLFLWGQYFNRNDTWAEQAGPWVAYLARSSHLLQQGRFVADVAYFYGEERNLTELFLHDFNTDIPPGYAYDYINPEALLTLLSVREGRIVTPSGMSYALLFVPDHVQRYTTAALRKLRDLVAQGATVVVGKPVGGLGVLTRPEDIEKLSHELWGDSPASSRRVGQGQVFTDLGQALDSLRLAPDFECEGCTDRSALLHLHRRSDEGEIYFISNQSDSPQNLTARFRVSGLAPEIWRAETGNAEPAGYRQSGGRTEVPLELQPREAVFVVFRRPAAAEGWSPPPIRRTSLRELQGPWRVIFEPGRGAPAEATFENLISWPASAEPGIRYFSGAATYHKTIRIERGWLQARRRIEIDLGEVHELAVVWVNGRKVATAWHPPYRVDITDALKRGDNDIRIEVVNLWPNRIIGDAQPGAARIAYAPDSPYNARSELLPSGLLGPVRIVAVDQGAAPGDGGG